MGGLKKACVCFQSNDRLGTVVAFGHGLVVNEALVTVVFPKTDDFKSFDIYLSEI
jgi:hypothetical protein